MSMVIDNSMYEDLRIFHQPSMKDFVMYQIEGKDLQSFDVNSLPGEKIYVVECQDGLIIFTWNAVKF